MTIKVVISKQENYLKIDNFKLKAIPVPHLNNPRNPGGIKATLERWYQQYKNGEIENDWISFDGVEVIKTQQAPISNEWRMIGSVSDIASIEGIHPDAHLTFNEWLYNDY
jgi:hypothetical protein